MRNSWASSSLKSSLIGRDGQGLLAVPSPIFDEPGPFRNDQTAIFRPFQLDGAAGLALARDLSIHDVPPVVTSTDDILVDGRYTGALDRLTQGLVMNAGEEQLQTVEQTSSQSTDY